MAHRHASKLYARRGIAGAGNGERWFAAVLAIETGADFIGQAGDVGQQAAYFFVFGAATQAGYQLDRVLQVGQISLQLGLDIVVQHGVLLGNGYPGKRRQGQGWPQGRFPGHPAMNVGCIGHEPAGFRG